MANELDCDTGVRYVLLKSRNYIWTYTLEKGMDLRIHPSMCYIVKHFFKGRFGIK